MLPWDVVLGVLTVIGESSEQVAATANQREAVSEAGAGWQVVLWSLGLQALPLPTTCLTGSQCFITSRMFHNKRKKK